MLKEARIAVALDDKDAMSHGALAIAVVMNGGFEAGLAEARAALALNPNNAQLIAMFGAALCHAGHPAEAIDPLRRAMRASPHDPQTWQWTHWLGMAQFFMRDFEAALETCRQAVHMNPGHSSAHMRIIASLAYLGRLEEAREALERVRAQFPDQYDRMRQRPPYLRPEQWAIQSEGLRLAAGETA